MMEIDTNGTGMVEVEVHASIFPASERDKESERTLVGGDEEKDWYRVLKRRFPDDLLGSLDNPFCRMGSAVGALRTGYLYRLGFGIRKGVYLMSQEGWGLLEHAAGSTKAQFDEQNEKLGVYLPSGRRYYDEMVHRVTDGYDNPRKEEDYPSLDRVMEKYGKFHVSAKPNVGPELFPAWMNDGMRAKYADEQRKQFEDCTKELLVEIARNMVKVSELWSKPKPRIVEATIENLNRALDFVKAKNLNGDREVDELADSAKEMFSRVDADSLRASAGFRVDLAKAAKGIAEAARDTSRRRFA